VELRRRRDLALADREYQSYLRRLIQVRQDILVSERARRKAGAVVVPLVRRLTRVLAEGPRGPGRGEAPRFTLSQADAAEAERRADALVPAWVLTEPDRLSSIELEGYLAALDGGQKAVSGERASVIRVHDRLQQELRRRYRDDPSRILHD